MCFIWNSFRVSEFWNTPIRKIHDFSGFSGNSATGSPPRHPISHAAWTHDLAEQTAIAIIAHDAKKQKQGDILLFSSRMCGNVCIYYYIYIFVYIYMIYTIHISRSFLMSTTKKHILPRRSLSVVERSSKRWTTTSIWKTWHGKRSVKCLCCDDRVGRFWLWEVLVFLVVEFLLAQNG